MPQHDKNESPEQPSFWVTLLSKSDRIYPWTQLAVILVILFGLFMLVIPGPPVTLHDGSISLFSSADAPDGSTAKNRSTGLQSFFSRFTGTDSTDRSAATSSRFSVQDGPAAATGPEYDVISAEKLIRFKSQQELDDFLAKLKRLGLSPLDYSGNFLTVRLLAGMLADHPGLLEGINPDQLLNNHLVLSPDIPDLDRALQLMDLEGYGDRALELLGGLSGTGGTGVTVAILDTRIEDHPALDMSRILQYSMLSGEDTGSGLMAGHGTAVATIIASIDPNMPGAAQGVTLLGFTVLDSDGRGDTFTLAKAIIAAVDAGANIINMSLGSYANDPYLQEAILYARERGVGLVAATGNDGVNMVAYPAGYEGVTGTGANDALGQTTSFSNKGEGLDGSAPGYEILTGWSDGQYGLFSGTSAAAPFVAAIVGDLLSENPGMTPAEATQLLFDTADDKGPPDWDLENGYGALNPQRAKEKNTPGIYDLAAADFYLPDKSTYPPTGREVMPLWLTVQNRGTEPISDGRATITIGNRTKTYSVDAIDAGRSTAIETEIRASDIGRDDTVIIKATVSTNREDKNSNNNHIERQLVPTPSSKLPPGHP